MTLTKELLRRYNTAVHVEEDVRHLCTATKQTLFYSENYSLWREVTSVKFVSLIEMFVLGCRMANQLFLGYAFPGNVALTKAAIAPFRLWPTDIDFFGHMNNASYIRVAELSRWSVTSSLLHVIPSSNI